MAWEKFVPKKPHREYKTPTVAAWKSKFLSITKGAVDTFNLADYEWCTLYHDKEKNLIGIEFAMEKTNKAQKKITSDPRNPARTIHVESFLAKTGLDLDGPSHYPASFDEEQNMLVIDLNKKMKTE